MSAIGATLQSQRASPSAKTLTAMSSMTLLATVVVAVLVATGASALPSAKNSKHGSLFPLEQVEACDGTECPAGCCPFEDYHCCESGTHCAVDVDGCPETASATKAKTASLRQHDCHPTEETTCPTGCCPMPGWHCCAGGLSCSAIPIECPAPETPATANGVSALVPLEAKSNDCPGAICSGGCCMENWFCCANDRHCAQTADVCPDL